MGPGKPSVRHEIHEGLLSRRPFRVAWRQNGRAGGTGPWQTANTRAPREGRERRRTLPVPIAAGLQSTTSVTVQLIGRDPVHTPLCFEATLDHIKTQDATRFKARS